MVHNILVTCGGGLVIPGILQALRNMPFVGDVITVDMVPDAVGAFFATRHHLVPAGSDPAYADAVSELCRRERISAVLPFSDEEVLSLCRRKDDFRAKGVAVLCPQQEAVENSIYKDVMLAFLLARGVPTPRFAVPRSREELVGAVRRFGYPEKKVVVKPAFGRGGRGVVVLDARSGFLGGRSGLQARLEWLAESLDDALFPRLVVMEYLGGEDYSVDCLCNDGKVVGVVPKKRLRALGGPSQRGAVHLDGQVLDYAREIAGAFGFTGNVNIQMRYPEETGGAPLVYEINPRLAGTIAATAACGADLLAHGLRQALGMAPEPIPAPREIRFMRHFNEVYY